MGRGVFSICKGSRLPTAAVGQTFPKEISMNGWQQTLLEWAYTLCAPGTAHAWEIYDRIVNIYLGEGRVEEALKIGDQLDDPNCYYLGKLASSLARIGRSDLSHRIIASIEAYYQIAPA